MSILIDANSRIIVQGITGRRGRFHSERMLNNHSPLVGGTSPGKGGEWVFTAESLFLIPSKTASRRPMPM